jgi:hypothetical protein
VADLIFRMGAENQPAWLALGEELGHFLISPRHPPTTAELELLTDMLRSAAESVAPGTTPTD